MWLMVLSLPPLEVPNNILKLKEINCNIFLGVITCDNKLYIIMWYLL